MKNNACPSHWLQWIYRKSKPPIDISLSEAPLRAELFNADQMAQHGKAVALSHHLTSKPTPDKLLSRLADNEEVLQRVCQMLASTVTKNNRITPAAEWLLDNFYLIEEQILLSKQHLPKKYGQILPHLGEGPSQGYPRVYDIALQVIAHSDGRFSLENLNRFVSAYQNITALTLGELWAIPIMLRLALIENLRRVSAQIAIDRTYSHLAANWAEQMVKTAEADPKNLILVIANMARSNPPMISAFVAELARCLHGCGAALALPLSWIDQRLAEKGLNIEQLIQAENQQQTAYQVTVSNSIGSLRRLLEIDWREFVEGISIVHHILNTDPMSVYGKMDFNTRDRYRHVVERLARANRKSEEVVATTAITLAQSAAGGSPTEISANPSFSKGGIFPNQLGLAEVGHVGFYLIDAGLAQLEQVVGIRCLFLKKLQRFCKNHALLCYLTPILLIASVLTGILLSKAAQTDIGTAWLILMGIATLLCTSQLGLSAVNWWIPKLLEPHPLPKMDFSKGIPAQYRTLVVVPAMLNSPTGVESLIGGLEVRFLANRTDYLHFALLTDFKDAAQKEMPEDAALLTLAQEGIASLNTRYPGSQGDRFFLFHRPRRWNEGEGVWMGYERKRGKLCALNRFLGSLQETPSLLEKYVSPPSFKAKDVANEDVEFENFPSEKDDVGEISDFSLIVGNTDSLSTVKYVITLDSDTQLPHEAAQQMISAMAHPLNRPHYDSTRQRVVAGYGILQPRMGEALPLPGSTRYMSLWNHEIGIDPYTRTVSDVYQDVFDEGSFIGKGIYDVAMFRQALENRFPENTILSHDLLEGCYLRSGLLSDVALYEQSPASYLVDAQRRTRWIRGDWQLIGWLLPRVRTPAKTSADGAKKMRSSTVRIPNPLSALSRWKLFDNLRRSLVPLAFLVLLGLSWTIFSDSAFWFTVVLTLLLLPTLVGILLDLMPKPNDVLPLSNMARMLRRRLSQLILYLMSLPYEAGYTLVAILRTSWRMLISHRRLLEWVPFESLNHRFDDTPKAWIAKLWIGPVIAIVMAVILSSLNHIALLFFATPLFLLWLASPLITWWISRPFVPLEANLNQEQIRFLHTIARKTWGFFETFVTAEENWLPPDNYQETPVEALAHRTSPTNMGLALLANLTAYDFGYLTMSQLLKRTAHTLQTMVKLERYAGHFYNWYDTQTLKPLLPRYVSTVDSGNLAGYLLTLRQGLLELPDAPVWDNRYLEGLADTLEVLIETVEEKVRSARGEKHQLQNSTLIHFKQLLQDALVLFNTGEADNTPSDLIPLLCTAAEQIVAAYAEATPVIQDWSQKLLLQCQVIHNEYVLGEWKLDATPVDIIQTLAAQAFSLAQMENDFLYDSACHLMAVGFNVEENRRDSGHYDLLSSEARLGNFVAIAQGEIPQESWFALGRLLTVADSEPILVSWSGSMFEYLMPLLVMPSYAGTLLDQTCKVAVNRQIHYGKQRNVAWGVSESGYNAVDANLNYQYRAFGVPGIGFKRGLAEDLVIAPYATVMALMIVPEAACLNLQRLAEEGAAGRFGFYEAIDYTVSRLPRGATNVLIRSFMVHHQGMSFLALSYLLHKQPMQRRFTADPLFKSTLLLLQERIPKPVGEYSQLTQSVTATAAVVDREESSLRVFTDPNTPVPEVHLLSNGNYHVMLTQAGGGYSRWKDIAVLRWRADSTCDNWGLFCYVRDVDSGVFWSTTYQPTAGPVKNFTAVFSEAHAEFKRRDGHIDTHTEVVISPEDDIELRRLHIHNHGKTRRTLELTSYGEIVLAPQVADQVHPAFSNLFIETELLPEQQAILATRRPRNTHEQQPWLFHLLNVHIDEPCIFSFETDRNRFVGRTRTLAAPSVMVTAPGLLSDTAGAVLDPIVSIRCQVTLEPGASIAIDLVIGVTESREHCISLLEKYRDIRLANRVFKLSWMHSQVLLHQLNASEVDAKLYAQLAGAIIYPNLTYHASANILTQNQRGQSGLWGYSISGDFPIVLVSIEDADNIDLVRQLIQAHTYWRQKELIVDLVILNEERTGYRQFLHEKLTDLIPAAHVIGHAGSIFMRSTDQMPPEDRILLQSVAHVILSDKQGLLAEQLMRRPPQLLSMPHLIAKHPLFTPSMQKFLKPPVDLQFFNGWGGFSPDGNEYVITLAEEGNPTPAPWVNVLANPNFGTVVSESGQGYTWTENAHELRLTPWNNDPVQDSAGEIFYLRDEESGYFWSATALPRRGKGTYITHHGFGYSVFKHMQEGIYSELCMYVALDASVKFFSLKVRNDTEMQRQLSVTGYVEWVLGDFRVKTGRHVVTEIGPNGELLARNYYNTEFGERTVFFDAATAKLDTTVKRTVTGDRIEFLGRNGSHQQPAALQRKQLSGRVGIGVDPCAAIQLTFDLSPGQTRELVFTLGVGENMSEAHILAERWHGIAIAQAALTTIRKYWDHTLHNVRIKTPDPTVDLLANGWLLYQVLSSRMWGRSGYYQSGGAFGFRDQLQDAMALVHTDPQQLRAHLLLCAGRQFVEGDVQHWWHPPYGRGARTRCSDDYLWLPFVLSHYVETTGDLTILDETVGFLHGRRLNPEEHSYYDLPAVGNESVTLYQHGVCAILHGLQFGMHGLPLIGTGDWNDGMDLVGIEGCGESIWLGFFLYSVLKRFATLARCHGDIAFAERCDVESTQLQQHIERNGWDGEWYRRAYFDDGTPLGSASNTECRIDAIAQSWAVLSGAAEAGRAKKAMDALNQYLVRPEDRLMQLLDPPFGSASALSSLKNEGNTNSSETASLNPGYIKGYVPGVRENGGQYTHAAIWASMAFAELGENQLAWSLFNMLNPINHGRTPAEIAVYKVEPYVVAADVYGVAPHTGRGGWSWYTGSAGWMYRLIIESLLGLKLENNQLRLAPCLPPEWEGFQLDYYYKETMYQIVVKQVNEVGEGKLTVDDVILEGEVIPLVDDQQVHQVNFTLTRIFHDSATANATKPISSST